MKEVQISDEAYAALQRLAADWRQPAEDVLEALLAAGPSPESDGLLFHLLGVEFAAQTDPDARYLALLTWIAHRHAADFADFISHQDSARRYLLLDRTEVNAIRARHQTRQLDRTPYWAVMDLDAATRRRFVRRLLDYIGCHEETIVLAVRLLGLDSADRGFRLLSA